MNKEQGLLKQMILWLWKRYERASRGFSDSEKLEYLRENIIINHRSFNERELENLLNSPRVNFLDHEKFLFLEPPEPEGCVLPVLTMQYEFDPEQSSADFCIRIALFLLDENENPVAIGFRFESPEKGEKHNFYHAQPIRSFSIDEMKWPLPSCPKWLPVKYPTFAIDAQNPPSLLVSLLISLYGVSFRKKLEVPSELWDLLKPYVVKKMICLDRLAELESRPSENGKKVRKMQRRK